MVSLSLIYQNRNTMTQATLTISKVLTVIIGSSVRMFKLGQVETALNGVDVFTVSGTATPSKVSKYQAIIEANGYTLSQTNWFDNAGFGKHDANLADVMNFSFIYTK